MENIVLLQPNATAPPLPPRIVCDIILSFPDVFFIIFGLMLGLHLEIFMLTRHNVSTVLNPFIKVYNLHFSGSYHTTSHHLKPHTWYVAMPGTEKWKVITPEENNRSGGSSLIIHDNFRVRMEFWS